MISYHTSKPPTRQEDKREAARRATYGFLTEEHDTPERMAYGLVRYTCAPAVFRRGHRLEANFLFADWLGLDFDSGEMTVAQAVQNVFCDMIHVIGVTMSHQTAPEFVDKFRVFLPMERRIEDLRLYRHQMQIAKNKWPCDKQCVDAARLFFPCSTIISVNDDGYKWEIDEKVPPEPDYAERDAARVKHGIIPRWALSALRAEWPPHTKNDTCFKLGCALGILGYSPEEITALILDSPTYQGKAAPKKEIFAAVRNGVETGIRGLPPNQKQGGS